MSPTTRKMSDRHEEDIVALLGGTGTRNSGAVWSDQGDGHQTNLDQYWRFAWDGKSTLGLSISVTRAMWAKTAEQTRGLLPLLPLRFYRDSRLTQVDLDLIAVEAETFAEILSDANAYRALLADTRHQIKFDENGWVIQHPAAERISGTLFSCPSNDLGITLDDVPAAGLGRYYLRLEEDGFVIEEEVA